MHTLLLQSMLDPREVGTLYREFPHYRILALEAHPFHLGAAEWPRVEVLFGSRLSVEELENAKQLRWIHLPSPDLRHLCLPDIIKRENILITFTPEEDLYQMGEYVIGTIFALAKKIPLWKDSQTHANGCLAWTDSLWTLKDCTLLQIGLGDVGSEVARQAQRVGLHVIGAQEIETFHPHCKRTVSYKDLTSVLSQAEIVCLALPQKDIGTEFFGRRELEVMKRDSILIILDSIQAVDLSDLASVAKEGRLRGVVIDDPGKVIAPESAVWREPSIWVTPGVASLPHRPVHQAFHLFHYNLRQYQTGNFADMRYRVNIP